MISTEASNRITDFEPIRLDFGPFAGISRHTLDGDPADTTNISLTDLEDYLNSVEFLNILRYYMQSDGFRDDFRSRIDEFLNFDRSYYILQKDDVYAALNDLSAVNTLIPDTDRLELLKQKDYYGFGQAIDYNSLATDFNIYDHLTQDQVEILLQKQSTFYNRIPNFNDLESNNVIQQIFQLIDDRSYLSEDQITTKINEMFTSRLTDQVFITYDQIVSIIDIPQDITTILSDSEYLELLKRHSSKLQIITSDILNDFLEDPIIYPMFSDSDIMSIINSEQEVIRLSKDCLLPSDIVTTIENYIDNSNTTNTSNEIEILDTTIQDWILEVVAVN